MGWRDWVIDNWFGDVLAARVREAVDFAAEDRGWRVLAGTTA